MHLLVLSLAFTGETQGPEVLAYFGKSLLAKHLQHARMFSQQTPSTSAEPQASEQHRGP